MRFLRSFCGEPWSDGNPAYRGSHIGDAACDFVYYCQAFLQSMPNQESAETAITCEKDFEEINLRRFVQRNKLFLAVSIGTGGIFFSNAVFNNFMLQIVEGVGGNRCFSSAR